MGYGTATLKSVVNSLPWNIGILMVKIVALEIQIYKNDLPFQIGQCSLQPQTLCVQGFLRLYPGNTCLIEKMKYRMDSYGSRPNDIGHGREVSALTRHGPVVRAPFSTKNKSAVNCACRKCRDYLNRPHSAHGGPMRDPVAPPSAGQPAKQNFVWFPYLSGLNSLVLALPQLTMTAYVWNIHYNTLSASLC